MDTYETEEFTGFVGSVEGGRIAEDATHHLKELIVEMRRVAQTSGGTPKGKLAITFTFKLDRNLIEVDGAIAVTMPRAKRERTLLFLDKDGRLALNNPQQIAMELPAGPAPVRDVPAVDQPPVRKVG
jgi:hypothetical protein